MNPVQPPVAPNGDIIQHQPPVNDRGEFLLEDIRGDGDAPPLNPERATLLPPSKNKEERMRWLLEKFPGLTSEEKVL